jgi:hypothetical protein
MDLCRDSIVVSFRATKSSDGATAEPFASRVKLTAPTLLAVAVRSLGFPVWPKLGEEASELRISAPNQKAHRDLFSMVVVSCRR